VHFENRKNVRFLKRAQICVADLWAAFNGEGFGQFDDIEKITMFADYRVPRKSRFLSPSALERCLRVLQASLWAFALALALALSQ
jgi:hypothetical protein